MRFFCCLIISCLLCFWYVKCITQELGLWSVCDTILSSSCRRIGDVLSIRRADSQKGAEAQPKKCPRELEIAIVSPDYVSGPVGLRVLEQSARRNRPLPSQLEPSHHLFTTYQPSSLSFLIMDMVYKLRNLCTVQNP